MLWKRQTVKALRYTQSTRGEEDVVRAREGQLSPPLSG